MKDRRLSTIVQDPYHCQPDGSQAKATQSKWKNSSRFDGARVDSLQGIEEGWCGLRNNQLLPCSLTKKKLCQLGYTYKMSDDGYGGGGGDDYDYGGPRSVPLSYPLREHC